MKVVHITYSYFHGGAGIACKRLVEAQRKAGIDAHVITQESGYFPDYIHSTTHSWLHNKLNFFRHALEKLIFLFFESSAKVRFLFSLGNTGENIHNLRFINEADIIHFHWFNAGFVSLKGFEKILKKGKPVIWTLHDMWAFTGGCHYAGDCQNYQSGCGNCPYLKNPGKKDLSTRILKKKQTIYSSGKLYITTPSNWMAGIAKQSLALKGLPVTVIGNTLSQKETGMDKDLIKEELGLPIDKKLILFGAFNVEHTRKGSQYLWAALKLIKVENQPELMVFGKKSEQFSDIGMKVHFMGYSSDETYLRKIYQSADVFVNPSIEDNLPNTILESLIEATPVVAFRTGGMPDMIDHKKNGYLANFKDPEDLAEGIAWCLRNNSDGRLSKNAVGKINVEFSEEIIAQKFKKYYAGLLQS
jgi:glycosyltransferase involved in cell wall biosynthesis